jgi:dolichol kinase
VTVGAAPLTVRRELARKTLHLLWSVVPIAYALGVARTTLLAGLLGACTCAMIVELGRSRSVHVRTVFHRATGLLLREHEHHRWSGATWLLLSFLLVVLLFDGPIAIAAMWAVAVGDASGAIVGRIIGRHRIGRSLKTVEGSIACAVATAGGAALVAGLSLSVSIIAGVIAAAAEWPARPFDDNLRIGLGVGAGILLSRMVFS